jgi:CheY-like chemotaxis protein
MVKNLMTSAPKTHSANLVLVVDDDVFSQDYFAEILVDLGVGAIQNALNGREGLRTLAALPRPPDLLICDVFMPDMDGIEFLDHLSNQGYAGGVMLVSGQDVTMMAIAQEVALESGLNLLGAYTKPVPMAAVAAALTRAAPLAP